MNYIFIFIDFANYVFDENPFLCLWSKTGRPADNMQDVNSYGHRSCLLRAHLQVQVF